MEHKTYHGRPVIWSPQPRQAAFMARTEDEALYGGAAGGGKSDALIIEALRQVHIPHYRALILRKTYPQLSELIDKTMRYYKPVFPRARYNGSSHCWTFPSGAKIYFGSLNHAQDKYNYQGKAFDFIGVDELTHFTWDEYSYVMSRNRPSGPGTRIYIRATANPGGVGHGWVKARFISPAPAGTRMVQLVKVKAPEGKEITRRRTRIFIPSTVFDNPALLENALLATPHIAGYSEQGKANATAMSVASLARRFGLPLEGWYPPQAAPARRRPISWQELCRTIGGAYDIASESRSLKERPGDFESMRDHYAYRREYF